MRRSNKFSLYILLPAVFGILGVPLVLTLAQSGGAPDAPSQAPVTSSQIIRAEANLVLVDVIATDKKGGYVKDLEAKEFQVFEDNRQQQVTTFSRPAELQGPQKPEQPRYIVLFFDDSTMSAENQMLARRAADQFVEKTASPERLMAVVDFVGTTRIVQNFTSDGEKLKRAAANVQFSAVSPNISEPTADMASLAGVGGPVPGMGNIYLAAADFGARSFLLAIRNLANSLRTVPGRKTLILFSEGFPLTSERQPELDATIDAANRANVAIYAIDARGLVALPPLAPGAFLLDSPFPHESGLLASLAGLPEPDPQHGAGGGGPGGGGGGGGTGGGGGGGGEMTLAPDGNKVLVQVEDQAGPRAYLIQEIPKTGDAPTINATNPAQSEVPVRKLTTVGGEFATWSWFCKNTTNWGAGRSSAGEPRNRFCLRFHCP